MRLMQATMSDLVFQIVLIYLDDLLVFSPAFQDHLVTLEMVLKRLKQTGLKSKWRSVISSSPRSGFLVTKSQPKA